MKKKKIWVVEEKEEEKFSTYLYGAYILLYVILVIASISQNKPLQVVIITVVMVLCAPLLWALVKFGIAFLISYLVTWLLAYMIYGLSTVIYSPSISDIIYSVFKGIAIMASIVIAGFAVYVEVIEKVKKIVEYFKKDEEVI